MYAKEAPNFSDTIFYIEITHIFVDFIPHLIWNGFVVLKCLAEDCTPEL